MKFIKFNGDWTKVVHVCKTPEIYKTVDKGGNLKLMYQFGSQWTCKCGQVWEVKANSSKSYYDRSYILEKVMLDEDDGNVVV